MGVPITHTLAANQKRAMSGARAMTNEHQGETTLTTSDDISAPSYVIYVYNIVELPWEVRQPPVFPQFNIAPCEKGKKFSVSLLPAIVHLPFQKAGSYEIYYKNEDGRKAANSLVNPASFPTTDWNAQMGDWSSKETAIIGDNNNLNRFGVFWSLTKPDDPKLDEEIKMFRKRVTATMNGLIKRAEALHASRKTEEITPLMHFAMDYLGKQAQWHMSLEHMITCPNCGDVIKEGIVYHRNSFGDKCIIDAERYAQVVDAAAAPKRAPRMEQPEFEPDPDDAPEPKTARAGKKGTTKKA